MSTLNRSAPASPDSDARLRHKVTTKLLVSAVIVLGSGFGGAAQAAADPNPFGTLGSSCAETAPAGGPGLRDEIARGIRDGRSAWLKEQPAS